MTIISITESQIRDHKRNAELYMEFSKTALEEGKICMATMYKRLAMGHAHAVDRLERNLKKMRGTEPLPKNTAQTGDNLLDLGRDSLTGHA
jgi:rubrerythrin